ncbi:SsrA-binding protein SmpB [Desulfovibrio litoralis]|uniref:SsrA-binding protein n=1 Tax=Desulfovibrio litoralis DSM 11393 TaxID=1121455 RepID=A0A1M7T2D7_9BACT|nr:SsrA-binding protein SmpB [Desulfovibrio litoralis]SHN64868.1 SsrA-binding protein [Desulfovibrio litoralis DSM 11393]
MNKTKNSSLIAQNKKARHLYELLDFFEAGLVLTGPEVKSLRAGKCSFTDAYVEIKEGEAFVSGLHIAPYANAGYAPQNPDRLKKLLLHNKEIHSLTVKLEQKGLSVVPTKIYFKNGKIKLEIALGRGKKLYDQRETLKRRAIERDMEREI